MKQLILLSIISFSIISCSVKEPVYKDAVAPVDERVRDLVSSVVTPVRELKRFSKVLIRSGETKRITFELPVKELALWNINMKEVVEPGEFELQVGSASDNILLRKRIIVWERLSGTDDQTN